MATQEKIRVMFALIWKSVIYLTCSLTAVLVAAQAPSFAIEDFAAHVSISDPQLSPSGEQVAFVRMSATEDLSYQYEIVLTDTDGVNRRSRTNPDEYAHSPRWLSDEALSYLALTKEGGHQVFVLNLGDGVARQVSNHPLSLQGYSWSPDKTYLAYAAREKSIVSPIKAFKVTRYALSPPKPPQGLYILEVAVNKSRKMEGASVVVDRWSGINWSPDGSKLLYMQKNPDHFDEYSNFLVELSLSSGEERKIGTGAYPQYSPDGNRVLFLARETPEYPVGPRKVYLLNSRSGEVERVAPSLDREVLGRLLPSGQVLLNGPDLDSQQLWVTDLENATPLALDGIEPTWPLHASWVGNTLAFVGVTESRAQELYVYREGSIRRATNENDVLTDRKRGKAHSLTWQSPDGLQISGIALFPPDFQEGQRYPLVVTPHGGPHTSSTIAGVSNNLINQTLVNKGWIVFSPNYRGSSNQGRDFHLLRVGNPMYDRDVIKDVMSGITALDSQCGCVNKDQQALLGTSYGGRIAAWASALHPEDWVAAVVGNADLDDIDMYTRSDRGVGFATKFGGPPWRREFSEAYRAASPIYAAHQITTPTLIISTLRDPRAPVSSSFKFWKALEDSGTKVEFIAYDMSGHGPSNLVNSIDYWKRAIEWIDDHFGR